MPKSNVFLDSSVIIAALLSPTGGSFYIIEHCKNDFVFQINKYSLDEIQNILGSKFAGQPELKTKLFLLLGITQVKILDNPPKKQIIEMIKHISENDTPILASALKHSDYLITLDNEFLEPEIVEMAKKKSLIILKPKEFIETYRKAS
jgi:predicted nucleic acid-binding protein